MKMLLLLIGMLVCAAGIFFAGQGLGYINWPASSFMISQMKWVYYGGGLVFCWSSLPCGEIELVTYAGAMRMSAKC